MQVSQDQMTKAVIAVAVVGLLFFLIYHPVPTDDQVRAKIMGKLMNRDVAYRSFGGPPITFRISEQQIAWINKTVAENGTTWTALWRSGPYALKFYFDQYGDNELGSEQVPLGTV